MTRLVVTIPLPLTDRLRALVVNQASVATLTCTFAPGGKFGGVGIRSHLYCAHCSQGVLWHDVAAGLALMTTAAALLDAQGDLAPLLDRITAVVGDLDAVLRVLDEYRELLAMAGPPGAERSE